MSAMEWLKKQWVKLAAGVAGLALLVGVYFAGHYKRNGELDFVAAKRELELNTARGAILEKKLQDVRKKQGDIVSDILAEELLQRKRQEANRELTDDEVIAHLRAHGLIK